MVDGKGWHNESTRHRMARLNGSAGGKLKAPRSISKRSKDIQLLSNNSPMGLWNKDDGWKVKTIKENDAKMIDGMRTFNVDADERVSKKLEHLEDKYGVDLTSFYGEDYTDPKTRNKLKAKLGLNKKPNVISVSNKKIYSSDAVKYHNAEAKKLLAKNDYAGYRFHTKEAIKINQKVQLLKMKKK